MTLFAKKSASQLKKEIGRLEKTSRLEQRRKELSSRESALKSKLRHLKYAKLYEARDKFSSFGSKVGHGIFVASVNVHKQLKHNEVGPAFKANFPAGSMVSVGKPAGAPTFRNNSGAFAVRLKK